MNFRLLPCWLLPAIVLSFAPGFLLNAQETAEEVFALANENIEKYRKGEVQINVLDEKGKALKGVQIEVNQKTQDFLFGALLFDLVGQRLSPAEEEKFKESFLELFNYGIVSFYWDSYERKAGHPRWDQRDPVVKWCMENGVTPKGHPLAWTHKAGMPAYLYEQSPENTVKLLDARIMENVIGFKDIQLWDVVNEPIQTVTWSMALDDPKEEHRYSNQVPVDEIVPWVEHAYKVAYEANPANHYVLNEFKLFADQLSRDRFYKLLEILLERDTPVSGIGIQGHEPRDEWYNPVEVWNTLNQFSSFGLPLHVTEFSPQSKGAPITGDFKEGIWDYQTQAEFTEMMYTIWFGHPAVSSINWWGFSDANGWLPGCGITDENMDPKPVYQVLKRLIKEEWMTQNLKLETDRKGLATFRGFYGEYEVKVYSKTGDKVKSCSLQLKEGEENQWLIEL